MTVKKKFTEDDVDRVESQVVPLLLNLPSGTKEVDGYRVVFKRPKLIDKYKARLWSSKQIKELGIENPEPDTEESNMEYYFRFLGALQLNVKEIYLPDGKEVTLDPALGYQFLLEQFLEENINKQFKDDDDFVTKLTTAYVDWIEESTPKADDLKNS